MPLAAPSKRRVVATNLDPPHATWELARPPLLLAAFLQEEQVLQEIIVVREHRLFQSPYMAVLRVLQLLHQA
jgi:hypothetical protein